MKKTLLTLFAIFGMATANYAQVTFEAVEGSDFSDNEGSAKACDGNTGTKWCKSGGDNCYLIVKASEATYIQGFVMTTANDNESYQGRTPKEYKLYGSDAQDGTYELIYHQTDDNFIGDKNYTDYTIYCNSTKKYQYFKLQILSSNLNGSTLFQISEFKLLPATVGFTFKEGAEKAFDGSVANKWEGGSFPTSVTVEASDAAYLTGYQFTTANDNASNSGRNPLDWKIEGSNDNTNWTEVVAVSNDETMKDVNYTPYYFPIENCSDVAYKYYKVTVTKNAGNYWFQMGEVALVATSTAHTWKEDGQKDATCTTTGYKLLLCEDCGATKYGDAIAKTSHSFNDKGLCENCSYPQENWMTPNGEWYEATSVDHFNWLAATVKNIKQDIKIRLTQDVDLTGFAGFGNGNLAVEFKGELDGNGHWLKNLTIDTTEKNAGLFGKTDGANIHDLGLRDCSVKNTTVNSGVLAGNMNNTTVNRVAVMSSYAQSNDHVGVIAGNAVGSTTISNCWSDATIKSTTFQAGGLVGTCNGMTLTKCLFRGTVVNDHYTVGGLVALVDGNNQGTNTISYNISAASILKNSSKDGQFPIVNQDSKTVTFTHNYIAASTLLQGENGGETVTTTNNFDDIDGSNGKTKADAEMTVKSFYTSDMGWDMENDWKFVAVGEYPVLVWMEANTAQTISISDAEYATVTSTKALDFSNATDITAYAAQVKENFVHLEQITNVPAGTAFVVTGAKGDYTVPFAVEALSTMPDNDLKVSDGSVQGGNTVYVLAKKSEGVGFYKIASTVTIPENKGYLLVDDAAEARTFIGFESDETTKINGVADNDVRESVIYNIAGQRISTPQKGINIVNGKKIMY
jgi:hypothetical protein